MHRNTQNFSSNQPEKVEQLPVTLNDELNLSEAELDNVTGGLNPQPIPPGRRGPQTLLYSLLVGESEHNI